MLFRSRAPLRLGLAGGGTDVSPYSDEYGGCVLNATIDLYAYCTIELEVGSKISIFAADRNESFESEAVPYLELEGSLLLHKGIYNRIIRQFNNNVPIPMKMTTYSDVPAGSGLGSSSTMVVAIIKCFAEALKLPLGDYDIAQMAFEIERVDLGLLGGKQDQYAATFGGFNFIEFYSQNRVVVNPLRIKDWITNELESSMVLFFTGTSRESSAIIEEQMKNTKSHNKTSVDAMHELKMDAVIMKEAILRGDLVKFAEYLDKSWNAKKRMASAISNDYLDKVYKTAKEAGAYAGKVSGAGGGGFMMFIVNPTKKPYVIKRLNSLDGQAIVFHFTRDGSQSWRI